MKSLKNRWQGAIHDWRWWVVLISIIITFFFLDDCEASESTNYIRNINPSGEVTIAKILVFKTLVIMIRDNNVLYIKDIKPVPKVKMKKVIKKKYHPKYTGQSLRMGPGNSGQQRGYNN